MDTLQIEKFFDVFPSAEVTLKCADLAGLAVFGFQEIDDPVVPAFGLIRPIVWAGL